MSFRVKYCMYSVSINSSVGLEAGILQGVSTRASFGFSMLVGLWGWMYIYICIYVLTYLHQNFVMYIYMFIYRYLLQYFHYGLSVFLGQMVLCSLCVSAGFRVQHLRVEEGSGRDLGCEVGLGFRVLGLPLRNPNLEFRV